MATPLDLITGTLLQRAFSQPAPGFGASPTASAGGTRSSVNETGVRTAVPDVFDRPQPDQVVQFPAPQQPTQRPQAQQPAPAPASKGFQIDPQVMQQAMLLQALLLSGDQNFTQRSASAFGQPQPSGATSMFLPAGRGTSAQDIGQGILGELNPLLSSLPEIQALFTPNVGAPFIGEGLQPNQATLGEALAAIAQIMGGGS